jgi:hypothetical protein
LTFAHPSGNAAVTFAPIPGSAEALKRAKDTLKEKLDQLLTDHTFDGEMESKKLNGLAAVTGTARGKLKQGGIPVRLAVVLVFTPTKQVLFAFALVAADKYEKLQGDVWGILRSIKPLPAATK